ncbi:unnamed protein product [Schistosoma intercalatum]|nr:unnamed protein product [Schistosoma intercalatum]
MIRLSLMCLTFISLTIARKHETFDAPFIIDKNGSMMLTINGYNYTLNGKLNLTVIDDICQTNIDFSRPNEKEKNERKGIRLMQVVCETEIEDDESTESVEATNTTMKKKIIMLYSIILFFILFELSITKEIDVYQLPFVITKSGAMIITDHEEKMSLSQDLLLIHKDVSCTTKIDLKRPTEAEIKAKSGTRKVFQ